MKQRQRRLDRCAPIEVPVRLHFKDGAFLPGTALNISRVGIFIKALLPPWRSGCVDVRFSVAKPEGHGSIRLPALIVHRSGSAVGLMFRALDAEAAGAVERLLSDDRPAWRAHPH
jgi:hypothetical protein